MGNTQWAKINTLLGGGPAPPFYTKIPCHSYTTMKFHDFNLTNTGYSNLPSNLVNSMESFLFHGTQPGGFLTAVLNNDLKGAIAKGDLNSRECLPELVIFIYNHFPGRFLRPNSVEEFLQSTIRYRVDDKGYCVSFDTNPINSERYNQDFWSDVNYV